MNKAEALSLAKLASEEAQRAFRHLSVARVPRVFYISHLIRDEKAWRVEARFGTTYANRYQHSRHCFTDVRVGSYRHDQVQEGGLHDNSKDDESYAYTELPSGTEAEGIRHSLWRLTDARYREAVDAYLRKKSDELTYVDRFRHLPSFEPRPALVDVRCSRLAAPDIDLYQRRAKRISALMKRYPRIKVGHVVFEAVNATRIFASTEGRLIVQCAPYRSLECYFWYLSERGDGIPWTIHHSVADPDELPTDRELSAELAKKVALLDSLSGAPVVRSFSGPVLLEPRPAGLMIHEALGHRLEGNRLLAAGEGQTFRDSLRRQILPPLISVRDDPTLQRFMGKSLVGHYRYDDEGVEAQNVQLIERGRLKAFLTSRAGISRRHASNGHGRSAQHERPISRMAVTIVESHDGLDDMALKERLLEEIRRQRVPYGIRILQADSGETATEGYNFQAFLGEISLAARVYPDGQEEWIRGVNFVGTPLNAVRSIVAAGTRYEVDNAHCGAESGYVPVSTISPALVLSHLELQSKSEPRYAQFTYPIPWREGGGRPAAARRRRGTRQRQKARRRSTR